MPELHVHIKDEPERLDELLSLLDDNVRVTVGFEHPERASCDVLVAGIPEEETVEGNESLRAIIIPWAGVPNRTRALMRQHQDVSVHNLHHNALQVAEIAMALLLAAAKWVVPLDASLRADDWSPRYGNTPIVLLRGKRALILGAGAIGCHIAEMSEGMGMRPTLVGRTARRAAGGEPEVRPVSELPELLPTADVLFVTLPLTDETRDIIGAAELALTPDQCILVNVGRGPVVEEVALYDALRDGTLHAAGLDVWYTYPTDEPSRRATSPSECPFRELPNVVMSPHRAGAPNTPETESLRMRALAELLNAAARGEEMPNRVDLELGY